VRFLHGGGIFTMIKIPPPHKERASTPFTKGVKAPLLWEK